MENLQVTTLEEIKQKSAAKVLELPGWDDEPFNAKLKRPSILNLAAKGMIPNSLLGAAQKMFTSQVDDKVDLKEISKVMETVASAALVEPTMEQLKEHEIELTDDQLAAIFSYVQGGLDELKNFRNERQSD